MQDYIQFDNITKVFGPVNVVSRTSLAIERT